MLKALKYTGIGLLVLSVVTLPFYWPFVRMIWVFMPNIPAPDYEMPATVTEARLQDIDYLSKLTEFDRSFSDAAKAEFARKLAAMESNVADMSAAAFYLALAEAVALADNGHTSISYRPQYAEFNTIGARLYEFSDGVFIVSTAPDKAHALGHRVVTVEGVPIEALQDRFAKYKGGNTSWRRLYSTLLVESPELLAAAGQADSPEGIQLEIESPDGEIRSVWFEGLSAADSSELPWRSAWQTLVPGGTTAAAADWEHIFSSDNASPLPRYLTQTSEALSYDLDGNGFYIRALPGFAVGERSIKSVYNSMLSQHAEQSLDYLVVDFRIHDGGDYTKSMAFAKAAPRIVKEDGDIYIITGPNTFSAAIVTAAMLKYYAGERGTIIGEPMGDREQFWAESGENFQLPNSAYYINYATGYHDWENGCKGEPYCYTINEMFEVPAGSMNPEFVVPQSFASYAAGIDVAMDWIDRQH